MAHLLCTCCRRRRLLFAACTERPQGWCAGDLSIYLRVDCNGDGMDDQVCYDASGNRGVILAAPPTGRNDTTACADTWPSVAASAAACPPVFSRKRRCLLYLLAAS